jgi:DNA-binding CsgD family transcriptional regulator
MWGRMAETERTDQAPKPRSATELQRVLEAERRGNPFLLFRDESGEQRIESLDPARERVTVGRRAANDIALGWDSQVSRAHAILQTVGGEWSIVDDGLSANGTFVNGGRVAGRHRLRDGDVVRFGQTMVSFRAPGDATGSTSIAAEGAVVYQLSPLQREVLRALCRPYAGRGSGPPATNPQIAAEVHLSVEAVKSHLRKLFVKFGLAELPQNEKRARLVDQAFQLGLVTERELTRR